jgi:hypothetical protein
VQLVASAGNVVAVLPVFMSYNNKNAFCVAMAEALKKEQQNHAEVRY